MRAEAIVELAGMMGSDARARKTYVSMQCPFAPFYHEKGTDNTPSLNVFVVDGGRSGWKCWSCNQHGTLPGMIIRWALLTKKDATLLLDLVDKEENSVEAICGRLDRKWDEKWGERDAAAVREKEFDIFSEEELAPFLGRVPQYILDRGFEIETCKAWMLGYDREWRVDGVVRPRLTIPIRRRDGKLVGLAGRAIDDIKEGKYWNYWNFPKSHYLFGENMVLAREAVIKAAEGDKYEPLSGLSVVEGYLDAIKWWEYEIPTVAIMGSAPSKEQYEMLKEYGRIYIALDADAGGESGVSDMLKTLRDRLPLFRVRFPDGKTDPKQCTREEAWTSLETAKRIS
jgi:hypothetical protein